MGTLRLTHGLPLRLLALLALILVVVVRRTGVSCAVLAGHLFGGFLVCARRAAPRV